MTGRRTVDRRTVLGALAGATGAALAGCSALDNEADATTTAVPEDRARDLAERFAPTLYFDVAERWFPTDPRPYERERDGETVVDGFAALDGYTERFEGGDDPPDPTVFYNVRQYADSPLAVVQYWLYSAFDQFTTNFHWHDWEVLHVFVDTDTGDSQLYVASSHSRRVPNNEFLDPVGPPRVLSELGSHSSALSLNEDADRFTRLPGADLLADVTNSTIEGVEDVAAVPLAYGLPRDEGGRLPYVVPELDGRPVYEDERLPSVGRADLLPAALTVRSFDGLSAPPADLPERETGLVFDHGGDADVDYDLVPTADTEHVSSFTGPQLRFEFSVPEAVEDSVASHLTAPGTPWEQERYENPAADITDPVHRRELADRYDAVGDPAPVNVVVAGVREAVSDPDAPDGEGVQTEPSTVEAVALLESDPVAVPTFGGTLAVRDVDPGEHRLTVNGPGLAPHSERVAVGDAGDGGADGTEMETTAGSADTGSGGVTVAGADGEIPVVAREAATKLAVDPADSPDDLRALAVEDDFAGRLYDAPLSGADAVYVHREGAYTAEVRDAEDVPGAFRVNPDPDPDPEGPERVSLDRPRTGKAPLAEYLADVAAETRAEVAAVADDAESGDDGDDAPGGGGTPGQGGDGGGPENAVRGLAQALAAIAESARRAAERAEAGDREGADASLDATASRLGRAAERLAAARDGLPPGVAQATDNRLAQADRRADQAREVEKL